MFNGGLTIESPSVVLDDIPPAGGGILVLMEGITFDVDENESLELEVTNYVVSRSRNSSSRRMPRQDGLGSLPGGTGSRIKDQHSGNTEQSAGRRTSA